MWKLQKKPRSPAKVWLCMWQLQDWKKKKNLHRLSGRSWRIPDEVQMGFDSALKSFKTPPSPVKTWFSILLRTGLQDSKESPTRTVSRTWQLQKATSFLQHKARKGPEVYICNYITEEEGQRIRYWTFWLQKKDRTQHLAASDEVLIKLSFICSKTEKLVVNSSEVQECCMDV